jgi:hypothetical protein
MARTQSLLTKYGYFFLAFFFAAFFAGAFFFAVAIVITSSLVEGLPRPPWLGSSQCKAFCGLSTRAVCLHATFSGAI